MARSIMIQGPCPMRERAFWRRGCAVSSGRMVLCGSLQEPEYGAEQFHHPEGLEMERAQVMQAEAAGGSPSVRMNPVLLKPTSDVGAR